MVVFKKNFSPDLTVNIWMLTLTFMTLMIIVIGGLTRLTESGLSIVDWRPIMGIIPPLKYESWLKIFANYKGSPEFQIVNKFMSLEEFKYIFWWEWFHRFFARLIGLIFIFPLLFFLYQKRISKKLFVIMVVIFIFGFFQAIVGWWMVKSGLNDNPYVSSYRLAFHLFNALIIFSILLWSTISLFNKNNLNNNNIKLIELFFITGIIFLFITIISGAFMAGTHAGKSFNTYPLMNGSLIPDDYFIKELGIRNFFENTVTINFNHRWLASFTFVFIFSFIVFLIFFSNHMKNYRSLITVLIFMTLQFLLGILTLLTNTELTLASMHQTNSVLLLGSVLFAYHSYKYR